MAAAAGSVISVSADAASMKLVQLVPKEQEAEQAQLKQ